MTQRKLPETHQSEQQTKYRKRKMLKYMRQTMLNIKAPQISPPGKTHHPIRTNSPRMKSGGKERVNDVYRPTDLKKKDYL